MDNVMQYDQVWNCEDVECGHGLFSDTIWKLAWRDWVIEYYT
jgi:hypothetical protein